MNRSEQIEQFKKDGRPIIRSLALMFEYGLGQDLCVPLLNLLREYRTECEQATGTHVYKGLLYQFSLAVGLFNLMHDNTDQAVATLKLTAKKGNIPAGIALWVVDQKLNSNYLVETEIKHSVIDIIGTNKCHVAFTAPLPSEVVENSELWRLILAKLQHVYDVGIYVRAVLNLILGNSCDAISDLTQFTQETGRLHGEVFALQMWNGRFPEAQKSLLALSNDQESGNWGNDYANAIEAYLSHASGR